MPILTEPELTSALANLPNWTVTDGKLTREWTFSTFSDAMAFVNRLADAAETANHRPDIDIRYKHVRISLISYDVGGITRRDLRLAGIASDLHP